MVTMMASTAHEYDNNSRYAEIKASEVLSGDYLMVNCAPDALVLNVETSRFQTILDIRHANGEGSALSRRPDEKVQIRKRQAKA